ncbi:SDR family NAD(P)-dependent oxidoreductase [Rhodoferax antarcticus]|uniref:SDR family NAD(P)-dependent oxidoreductase n=1 Tax=Rhodoferax antarcticus TaxID=81479 RepID=UPI0022254214|nr:SDR family NAD(P)-dependent oxidoreductase [Rhodoferax antarcticus]MCW2314216.1 NADPH:quinone reductase-like Zn-dependent oxidoreductase/acyl carrier protein [Rhodoferax antarcticus]
MSLAFVHDAFAHVLVSAGDRLQQALSQPGTLDVNLQPYFSWMKGLLQQDGMLTQSDSGTWQLESAGLPPAQSIWHALLRDYPVALPELVLAARLGNHLAALLQGDVDATKQSQSLLSSHQLDTLFDDSPTYLGTRLAVQHALRAVAANWPEHRRLRVLEVMAGANAVGQQLADEFPAVPLDYVIAHASEQAYEHLRSEYLGHPCMVVAKVIGDGLELACDSTLPDQFDIIIFRHTLHRANHPAGELAAARRKLSSGGLFMVAERHADMAADFIFGLTPQWWHSRPSGQQVSCLTTPAVWAQALAEQGFVDVGTFQEPVSGMAASGAYLMLAKRAIEDTIAIVAPEAAKWLLVCDTAAPSIQLAESLQSQLFTQGQTVAVIDAATLLADGPSALAPMDHVVYLATVPFATFTADPSDAHVMGILQLVQALAQTDTPARLWLVTAGGALVEGLARHESGDMQQGAIWGLGRVVMNEYPALQCTLIDLDIDPASAAALHQLQAELLHPDNEREIVLTQHGRLGLRMERTPAALPLSPTESAPRYRLDFRVPGQLRNLIWLPQPEPVLAKEDIEVRVVAIGLNFRDIMYLMGLLPDEAVENGFAGASLGLEFSGVVTRVSQPGGEFAVGDAVMGFGSACFASHVVTQATALSHKPASWSFESAATVPTVFFTVYYAFKTLANLQPGERVLIHGAAGGVGIAAVQLAQHLGAEIFATVGSEEKRDFVTLLGADHVLDSRSLAFADDILALTNGQGVDVVLNSLAGEAIRRNLRVLKPFGRFLELGKRDFFENTPIGLRPFKDNISYFGIDADQLLLSRPALAGQLFREVMALFSAGTLFPLPYRVFDARHALDAFRVMQQAQQIGKVVVKIDGTKVPVEPAPAVAPKVQFGKDSTWLITGGLTGFGLESARWLAQRGAGHLILVGRRGPQTPGITQAVTALEALGAQVQVLACDITDRAAVQRLLDDIRQVTPPLTGILHAAMVLDDALIANLNAKRMRQVLAPKMLGAWHLHSLSRDIPLEHFVLYSSVTTSIGNPGQANYVAANAALEKLASIRRAMGLPATCIGWGPIGDAGYLTLNQAVKESLEARLGAAPLAAHAALAMLDRLLLADAATTTVANFDWPTLSRMLPTAQSPRFATLRRQAGPAAAANADDQDIKALIAGKSPDEVRSIIQAMVTAEVAQVLCVNAERIDPVGSLHDQGMDSLMGIELAMGLEKRFGIQLPAMMLSQGPTVERVTTRIVAQILASGEPGTSETNDTKDNMDSVVALLAAQHGEEISADEMSKVAEQAREQTRAQEGTP